MTHVGKDPKRLNERSFYSTAARKFWEAGRSILEPKVTASQQNWISRCL
jgi:hypothetical protein